ncbi:voltage-dependent anion channel-domain-containing protein [Gautieria morchelliformis]|nr:voltage-dependent anion channel-domain-containing protein [Gautieria morchelliformis]
MHNLCVRHFSPGWFAINMGTGIISCLLHGFPYRGNPKIMNGFALAFFFLNLLLFSVFLALSVACYIMFPRIWRSILHHPVQSLYLGCFPMGADTLITVAIVVVNQYWGFGGVRFVYVLWAFWWLDAILSLLCCFGLIYVMATRHNHSMSTLTPLWLLPVVAPIVCSSTGQLLADVLIPIHLPHAFLTIGVSVVMAGYSFLLAGQNFKVTMPYGAGSVVGGELSGRILNVCCFFASFVLWCLGVWWLLVAFIATGDVLFRGHRIPFRLAFWGLVFSNGVHAFLTMQLAVALDATVFRVLGSIYGAAVILTWIILAIPTLTQVQDRSIFHAPYVDDDLSQPADHVSGESSSKRS